MNRQEAIANWEGKKCFCGEVKQQRATFCSLCTAYLQKNFPWLAHDVGNTEGEHYIETVASCELVLLKRISA